MTKGRPHTASTVTATVSWAHTATGPLTLHDIELRVLGLDEAAVAAARAQPARCIFSGAPSPSSRSS